MLCLQMTYKWIVIIIIIIIIIIINITCDHFIN